MSQIVVIGSGFSGLSAACFAAKQGHEVTIYEKNEVTGGRARYYKEAGFTFDMGPSWYWMPDVFERFFANFGKTPSDYYKLVKLDPGFQIFFKNGDPLQIPAEQEALLELFESIEHGSAKKLERYLAEASFKYEVGMQQLVYKPALSWAEYANYKVLKGVLRTHMFSSLSSYVRSFFKDPRLVALMEFPVLFLGAMPQNIPALYSLMNHAALSQGTWYPMGGMYRIIKAMEDLATELGVTIKTNAEVDWIQTMGNRARYIRTGEQLLSADAIIASCDYHHTESGLLDNTQRNYKEQYWEKKTFAPSCLIYYVGVRKRIKNLLHHNLFFDTDMNTHAEEIYTRPDWPQAPLFYVCCPSQTDKSVAPEGMENLFILIPIAPGLEDNEYEREKYFDDIIKRIENKCDDSISGDIIYKRSYCINDFINDYHAYKGNAYGLANTLMQTAVLKPSIVNKHVNNLFYAGQLTVPGPGVPPALISGEIAANLANNYLKRNKHESTIRQSVPSM